LVTERDVARVEKKLGVRLPAHYRRFLIEQATFVAKAKRGGAFVPFFTTAKEIIDANQELRSNPGLRDTNEDKEPWPLKYLIVGIDGGGNDWCVDLTSKREAIWFFDSEAYGTFRRADTPTWEAFLEQLRSPKPVEHPVRLPYKCKKGTPAPDAAGDGSFAVKDKKGRNWLCYELRERTQEELLALIRGEIRTPSWLGEKEVLRVDATTEELIDYLTKQR
jgi:hypothetical protein